MKKTALQQLIDYMEQNQYFIGNDLYAKQQELLETEREQIEEAFIAGMEFIPVDPVRYKEDSEQYYKDTYQWEILKIAYLR